MKGTCTPPSVGRLRGILTVMLRYLTQRAIAFIPTLLGVSILIFAAIRLVPGDAITAMLGTEAGMLTETQRASLEAYFGLDKPPSSSISTGSAACCTAISACRCAIGQPVLDLILRASRSRCNWRSWR